MWQSLVEFRIEEENEKPSEGRSKCTT